ncbi:MAG: hypothetical protein K2P84_05885 [Undibacterium sp.]|nr:hypothetical protein [Undibacterium sp.]
MSFELPNLDSKSWSQLVTEMLRQIPQYTRQWTDYNDSDPGITLVQMLAWIDESLLYQANIIPLQNEENYLRWVLGLAFAENVTAYSKAAPLDHDFDFLALQQLLAQIDAGITLTRTQLQKAVLEYVQNPYLALSLSNVEVLAMQTNRVIAQQQAQIASQASSSTPVLLVAGAYAVEKAEACTVYILSDAKPQYQYPNYPNKQQYQGSSTKKRKLLMVQVENVATPESILLTQVQKYLTPRVIAGNQVTARLAQRTDINLAVQVICAANTNIGVTLNLLFAQLFRYFLPLLGGEGGQGWGYDSPPLPSDVEHLILGVPGIERIISFKLNYIPTMELDVMASLDVNAQLADLPSGTPAMQYRGLPRLRCLDVTAGSTT